VIVHQGQNQGIEIDEVERGTCLTDHIVKFKDCVDQFWKELVKKGIVTERYDDLEEEDVGHFDVKNTFGEYLKKESEPSTEATE